MTPEQTAKLQKITEEGKLLEAGWLGYRYQVVPATAGPVQIEETRRAFYAGAQLLFHSIMMTFAPGKEPTDADFKRIDVIHEELKAFKPR